MKWYGGDSSRELTSTFGCLLGRSLGPAPYLQELKDISSAHASKFMIRVMKTHLTFLKCSEPPAT